MSKIKIAINGFGRIGRQSLKALIERAPDVEVVAVNDLVETSLNALLFFSLLLLFLFEFALGPDRERLEQIARELGLDGRATFAGRVGTSLLNAAGLPELVADSLQAYETLALKLARDRDTLDSLRKKLALNRDTCALFDTARFTRHFEAALMTMRERQRAGQSPAHFTVDAVSS